jgi:hypothetical protein
VDAVTGGPLAPLQLVEPETPEMSESESEGGTAEPTAA